MRIKIEELLDGFMAFVLTEELPEGQSITVDLPGDPFAGPRRQIRLTEVKEEKEKGG